MKKIVFFICCFFLMINSVFAVNLSCPDIAAIGEVFSCSVEEEEFIGIKANYKFGNEFVYVGAKNNSLWKNYYFGSNGFSVGNVLDVSKFVMNFELKVTDEVLIDKGYFINLSDIEVVDSNYEYIRLDEVSSKIKIVSNDNTLKKLGINKGVLSPKFSSDVTSYKASVYDEKIIINAVLNDERATLSGDVGEKKLDYGVNNFVITVTSARGEVRNYYLYITRKVVEKEEEKFVIPKDSDFRLKSLTLSHGNLKFDKNTFLYNVDVSNDVEDIKVEAVASSKKASVKINKPEKLVVGVNNIEVIVTAEDGTIGKYIIVINRGVKLSSDASIKYLNIEGYELSFKSDVYEYELLVGVEDKLNIEVILNDEKASYKISGNNRLKDDSVININVKAEDGTVNNYKIKIAKLNDSNSDFILSGVSVYVLGGLVLLVIGVIFVKLIKDKHIKDSDE